MYIAGTQSSDADYSSYASDANNQDVNEWPEQKLRLSGWCRDFRDGMQAHQEAKRSTAATRIQAHHRGRHCRATLAEAKSEDEGTSLTQKDDGDVETDSVQEKFRKRVNDALGQSQDGAPSYADLAKLAKKRELLLREMDESKLMELMDIQVASPKDRRRTVRPITAPKSAAMDMQKVFLTFCRERRGSGLRAWRLDIDKKGTNRVPYMDFKDAGLHMGLSLEESRLAWQAYRPPGGCPATALEFHEFDPAEWDNLNSLLELLWSEFNFDVDLIWSYFDVSGDGNVDLEEFVAGARRIGFKGDAKHIFFGMDTAGMGSLWKEELHYLLILQPECHGHPEESPLVMEMKDWVLKKFGSVQGLCDKMGLRLGGESMTVHSLARKLAQLGFKGDCLHTAMTLSRCNHFVSRNEFLQVLSGHAHSGPRLSRSYAGRHMVKPFDTSDRGAATKTVSDTSVERPPWNGVSYDPMPMNKALASRERHYFSFATDRPIRDEMQAELRQKANQAGYPAGGGGDSNLDSRTLRRIQRQKQRDDAAQAQISPESSYARTSSADSTDSGTSRPDTDAEDKEAPAQRQPPGAILAQKVAVVRKAMHCNWLHRKEAVTAQTSNASRSAAREKRKKEIQDLNRIKMASASQN